MANVTADLILPGDASPTDVLSAKTFSAGTNYDKPGTMADNGSLGTITPTTTDQPISAGYTSGGTVAGSSNLKAGNIRSGVSIFGVSGDPAVVNTDTANATASQMLSGVTAFVAGSKITGTIPTGTNSGNTITPTTSAQTAIAAGEYASSAIGVAGDANLVAGNIRSGVSIFGVSGSTDVINTSTSSAPTPGEILTGKTAFANGGSISGSMPNNGALGTYTPTTSNQGIPAGYTSGGTVAGDANLVTANIRSGVSIFGVSGSTDVINTSTSSAPAASEILTGKTAFANGGSISGTMADNGALSYGPSTSSQAIPAGYTSGGTISAVGGTATAADVLSGATFSSGNGIGLTGSIATGSNSGNTITPTTSAQTAIAAGEYASSAIGVAGDANLLAANIKSGVSIFGVSGSVIQATGNATAAQVLTGYTASNSSGGLSGSMPNRGSPTFTPNGNAQSIAAGYYGGGTVAAVTVQAATGTVTGSGSYDFNINGSEQLAVQGLSIPVPSGATKILSVVAVSTNPVGYAVFANTAGYADGSAAGTLQSAVSSGGADSVTSGYNFSLSTSSILLYSLGTNTAYDYTVYYV